MNQTGLPVRTTAYFVRLLYNVLVEAPRAEERVQPAGTRRVFDAHPLERRGHLAQARGARHCRETAIRRAQGLAVVAAEQGGDLDGADELRAPTGVPQAARRSAISTG